MHSQNSPPAKNTRSQRNKPVPTLTERAPPDHTPSVCQLRANLDRGPPMEGASPSRKGGMRSRRSRSFSGLLDGYPGISQRPRRRLREAKYEEGEESEETEVAAAFAGAPEDSEAPNIAPSNKPLVSPDDGANDSIQWTAHSSSCPQGQFKRPSIQDSINEGT
ncbi:hypothetical protein O181_000267 [Austropuccinia psidii MF-1]|uniref:Uncharacterized protein n=1 Tax=Austropuccinia psidii MF-1 TaxID=1389203 RepID=A0A9Q3B8D3_9BASI|nr:hypothetical protein [Austropuccinia psidii MF-1]